MSSPSLISSQDNTFPVHCGLCGVDLTYRTADERLDHFSADYCLGYRRGTRMLGFLVVATAVIGAVAVTAMLFYRG